MARDKITRSIRKAASRCLRAILCRRRDQAIGSECDADGARRARGCVREWRGSRGAYDSDDLDVTADDILVLKNIGPNGTPGMPEAGYIPIPRKLAVQGVKDIVRISDGRISGTAFGTIVLHVTLGAAVGGPLAHVRTGDRIRLSVSKGEISLLISDEELSAHAIATPVTLPSADRGYRKLFYDTVTRADKGVDFVFLRATQTRGITPRR